MRARWFVMAGLLGTGCEQDLVSAQPDAAPDGPPSLPVGLDSSCIGEPWPTSAPDPLRIAGNVGVTDATVEIHAVADDALLAQGTSGSSASTINKYAIDVATGGVATDIYRKASKTGYADVYAYDAFPEFQEYFMYTPLPDPVFSDPSFVNVWGEHPDPSKGSITLVIFDCVLPPVDLRHVAHATVDAPPGAHVLYMPADGIVSDDAKLLTETTTFGTVLIVGLTPGTYDIPVHVNGVTYRSRPVVVHAGADTVAARHP